MNRVMIEIRIMRGVGIEVELQKGIGIDGGVGLSI